MKLALLALFFSISAFAGGGMAPLQTKTGTATAATTIAITMNSTPTDGSLMAIHIVTTGATTGRTSSISETGATWVKVSSSEVATTGVTSEVWYAANVASASTSITVNLAATLTAWAGVAEFPSMGTTASVVDTATTSSGSGAPNGSPAMTTGTSATVGQEVEVWFGGFGISTCCGIGGNFTGLGSGYISVGSQISTPSANTVYKLQADTATGAVATDSYSGSSAVSVNWAASLVAFKALPNTIARRQTTTCTGNSATTCVFTLGSAPRDGNFLAITHSSSSTTTVSSVSQTGVTWAKATAKANGALDEELWYGVNSTSGGTSVTLNLSGTANTAGVIAEYYGIATSSPLDQSVNNSGTSSTASSGTTGTTAQASELFIFGADQNFGPGGPTSPTNGYALVGTGSQGGQTILAEKMVNATGTTSSTASTANVAWAAVLGTFKAAGAAAAAVHSMMLLGVGQ